ncbi:hypothetical protein [Haloprofundus halobius]|uniref:hypothetical protein n=1 Tax=Haloprofundus halobius TaxID=2876194 RepID=UPI001CCED0C6|nr:hypothetical protein [Haloprofundus halobius]
MTADESSQRIPLAEMECEHDDCEETPEWIADGENMTPTFVCDDHHDVFPSEVLSRVE